IQRFLLSWPLPPKLDIGHRPHVETAAFRRISEAFRLFCIDTVCRVSEFSMAGSALRQTLSTLNSVFFAPVNVLDDFGLFLFAVCQCRSDDEGKNDSLHFRTSKASESMTNPLVFMTRDTSTASKMRNATKVRTALSRIPPQDGPASKRRPAFFH